MKTKVVLCLAPFAFVALNLAAQAGTVRSWSDAELLNASDLVVIGQPIKVNDLDETNSLGWFQSESFRPKFRGVETIFKVSEVLQGKPSNGQIILHHYRTEIEWGNPPNGSDLIDFTPSSSNKYLMYLVKDGTNRYAPTAGQIDLGLSVIKRVDFSRDSVLIYHLDLDNPSEKDRARLAHDFPKLTPKDQFEALAFLWPKIRCPEFADALPPLVKLPKEPEQYNDYTLHDCIFIRLLELRPETVRPLILEDLQRINPLFSLRILLALPDKELPELDEVLLSHLNRQSDLEKIPSLIERYATARIVPQVIAFYGSAEKAWMCSLQTAILRYWLKHDRLAALQAIEKAVNFRKSTGCYTTVLKETLHDSFDSDAEKLTRKFVNDSDPEVAADAKKLLVQYGSTPPSNKP